MTSSLVGSEMCIRDRSLLANAVVRGGPARGTLVTAPSLQRMGPWRYRACLLYTSDAADDM
eukprot:7382165-Prorocentrum_lima.AAC.1